MQKNGKVKLAVTGGSGFLARGVLESCSQAGLNCRAVSRSDRPAWAGQAIDWVTIPSYSNASALARALGDADYVLHLADNPARQGGSSASEAVANSDALIAAAKAGNVKGCIVASSVYAGAPEQQGASQYGETKRAIERCFLAARDLPTVILRLPPVYGPGGRGGFSVLAKLVRKRLPLPLGSATAPRAYLSRRNFAALIAAIVAADDIGWSNAAGRVFEPSDGVAVSTRELVRSMADAMGVPVRLLPVPPTLLRLMAAVTGKTEMALAVVNRLDVAPVEEIEAVFGWRPIECVPQSLGYLRDELSCS